MNIAEKEILKTIKEHSYINQRMLAEQSGYSLGKVNQVLQELQRQDYLNEGVVLTDKARKLFEEHRPQNAIILAAGYGLRMLPINGETPKGLLEVNGEPLIERVIHQLQEAGIRVITVVVGFMKEAYEYLIDKYEVKLQINMEYSNRNNLHSLALVREKLHNSYIIPCDIWCSENPFQKDELYSWYMVSDLTDDESMVRVNRKQELVRTSDSGNQMIGIAYLAGEEEKQLCRKLSEMDLNRSYDNSFWEEALFEQEKMMILARVVSSRKVYEINTYEELKELDDTSRNLQSKIIQLIADILKVRAEQIEDIRVLKKGMTNRSFLFTCADKRYIMRIPGEGTEQLINRRQEYEVYQAIKGLELCDPIFYINPQNGYKMSAYLDGARMCDAGSMEDVRRCMKRLRIFHEQGLKVNHSFDIFGQIAYYESLWNGIPSCYRDYADTKGKVYELKGYIDAQPKEWMLTHMDAVPDNFLFVEKETGEEEIRLIDWEYAGMQDPHVDIAMFAIYALYEREQVEELIDAYFPEGCRPEVRKKIYAYIAACGLLWSNWCEYKRQKGVEFGEYALWQYRYAKEYYKIFKETEEDVSGR